MTSPPERPSDYRYPRPAGEFFRQVRVAYAVMMAVGLAAGLFTGGVTERSSEHYWVCSSLQSHQRRSAGPGMRNPV